MAVARIQPENMKTSGSNVFPVRMRSEPARSPAKRNRRGKHGDNFDPDELCRRLKVHQQAEQDARRRRHIRTEQRMAKEAYHHTPLFAAVDFARTATPALRGKKDVHKLSRSALQPSKKAGGALSPLQFVQQQERAQLRMEATAERNQFQLTKVLEDALVSDKARNINKRQQRDFKNALLAPKARSTKLRDPPTSPEDAIHSDPSNLDRGTSSKHQRALLPSDRHDWAQRDEGREVRMHGLEGEKIALPQCRDKEQESSSSKIQQAERDPAPEIPGDGIVARPIPYRQSHIKLRTLFKRQ